MPKVLKACSGSSIVGKPALDKVWTFKLFDHGNCGKAKHRHSEGVPLRRPLLKEHLSPANKQAEALPVAIDEDFCHCRACVLYIVEYHLSV